MRKRGGQAASRIVGTRRPLPALSTAALLSQHPFPAPSTHLDERQVLQGDAVQADGAGQVAGLAVLGGQPAAAALVFGGGRGAGARAAGLLVLLLWPLLLLLLVLALVLLGIVLRLGVFVEGALALVLQGRGSSEQPS